MGTTSIGQLLNVAYADRTARSEALPTLWNMVARRRVLTDLSSTLSIDTIIGPIV